jgi:hypothetical protein
MTLGLLAVAALMRAATLLSQIGRPGWETVLTYVKLIERRIALGNRIEVAHVAEDRRWRPTSRVT